MASGAMRLPCTALVLLVMALMRLSFFVEAHRSLLHSQTLRGLQQQATLATTPKPSAVLGQAPKQSTTSNSVTNSDQGKQPAKQKLPAGAKYASRQAIGLLGHSWANINSTQQQQNLHLNVSELGPNSTVGILAEGITGLKLVRGVNNEHATKESGKLNKVLVTASAATVGRATVEVPAAKVAVKPTRHLLSQARKPKPVWGHRPREQKWNGRQLKFATGGAPGHAGVHWPTIMAHRH